MSARLTEAEMERAKAYADLLCELGRDGNNPTEVELIMGCRDAARIMADILSELAALKRERDELRADFERYADHDGCEYRCTCGLDSARARHSKGSQ